MKTSRLVVFTLLVTGIVSFFIYQAQLDDNSRWAFVGVILLLAIIWVYLGDAPANKKPVARTVVNQQASADVSSEPSVDIPEIVVEDSLDGASLRERKMAKVAASRQEVESNDIVVEPDDDLEEVVVSVEEVHVADEFVVTDMSEPAAKSVVPPQVGVDGMVHRRDVTLARDVAAGDDLAGEVQSRRGTVTVVTKMLALHVADRHRTDRRLARLLLRFRRRMP